ncbi:MAG: oxygen-independent coproporphyrinogen III oxidase [Proteobacteria bacterium]|nr:oxygen-independent coproporphyrinogen III oxidase [Pseudomonadota bacterium]
MNEQLQLLATRVPRYTSYPTAPHFHAGVDTETYSAWLSELPGGTPISLYLHIPFCDTLCWFCGCHTSVVNFYTPVTHYLKLLFQEIERVSAVLGPRHPVTHIHWGGGSPTMLSPDDIRALNAKLRASFEIAPLAGYAIEIDPRELSGETIAALAGIGVDRASIGVQDCDERVQKAINRIQPFDVTQGAVERLRASGIKAINIDLVYGLPHQSLAHSKRTIGDVLTLKPDRIAVFGYAHVPHFKKHQKLIDRSALPGVAERAEQFDAAHAMLEEAGYQSIGLDHFALPGDSMAIAQRNGTLARNFQGYTTDSAPALIGLGASSIGALPQGYVQNIADVPAYRRALNEGKLPTARGVRLSDEDRLRRAIIERLMCDMRVDLDFVAAPFGRSGRDFSREVTSLAPLAAKGAVKVSGSVLEIPGNARAAARLVCAAFDTYLPASAAVHAVAV